MSCVHNSKNGFKDREFFDRHRKDQQNNPKLQVKEIECIDAEISVYLAVENRCLSYVTLKMNTTSLLFQCIYAQNHLLQLQHIGLCGNQIVLEVSTLILPLS